MYRTSSDPWTGTAAFNTYLRLQGAKVGKQVRGTHSGHGGGFAGAPSCLAACTACAASNCPTASHHLTPHLPLPTLCLPGVAGREVCVPGARPADHWRLRVGLLRRHRGVQHW